MTESDFQSGDGQALAQHITRRVFLRNMSVTAAAIVATACGGGGSTASETAEASLAAGAGGTATKQNPSSPTAGPNADGSAPVWNEIPTITFTQGVASTFSIAAYISDDDSAALTVLKNELALPPGVTYDPTTKSFIYDGIGSVGTTAGHVLTAMEG